MAGQVAEVRLPILGSSFLGSNAVLTFYMLTKIRNLWLCWGGAGLEETGSRMAGQEAACAPDLALT